MGYPHDFFETVKASFIWFIFISPGFAFTRVSFNDVNWINMSILSRSFQREIEDDPDDPSPWWNDNSAGKYGDQGWMFCVWVYMGITYNSNPQSYGESFHLVDDCYHLPINWIGKIWAPMAWGCCQMESLEVAWPHVFWFKVLVLRRVLVYHTFCKICSSVLAGPEL